MKTARSYNPYLFIWGAQWIVEALLAYFLNMERQSAIVSATLWLAVLLSLLLFASRWMRRRSAAKVELRSTFKQPPRDTRTAGESGANEQVVQVGQVGHAGQSAQPGYSGHSGHAGHSGHSVSKLSFLIPAIFALASIALLVYVQPMSHVLYELLRALMLAFIYSLLGVWLGRELIYLALWLFTLTAVLSIWFLGFAPLILLFFCGLSLLACAVIFRLGDPAQPATST